MKVGIIQQANSADITDNIHKLKEKIRQLANDGSELIVMQELHNGLYFCQTEDTEVFDQAEKMCIRDRCYMVQRIANEMDFYELVIFIEENRADYGRFIPVSYTHLDVYKRQLTWRGSLHAVLYLQDWQKNVKFP